MKNIIIAVLITIFVMTWIFCLLVEDNYTANDDIELLNYKVEQIKELDDKIGVLRYELRSFKYRINDIFVIKTENYLTDSMRLKELDGGIENMWCGQDNAPSFCPENN